MTRRHVTPRKEPRVAPKLACPTCLDGRSVVVPRDLTQPTDSSYRRHRRCLGCGCEYETLETVTCVRQKRATSSGANTAA